MNYEERQQQRGNLERHENGLDMQTGWVHLHCFAKLNNWFSFTAATYSPAFWLSGKEKEKKKKKNQWRQTTFDDGDGDSDGLLSDRHNLSQDE